MYRWKMNYNWRSLMRADAEQREASLQVASRCVEETLDSATASLEVSLDEQEQLWATSSELTEWQERECVELG